MADPHESTRTDMDRPERGPGKPLRSEGMPETPKLQPRKESPT